MNAPKVFKKRKKEFIDFATLSWPEIQNLRKKWEGSARIFEHKLQQAVEDSRVPADKIASLWSVGGSLWRRVRVLEKWLLKNKRKPL